MEKVYKTASAKETQQLGEDFAKTLSSGSFLALHGDLGAGKTTFVQGLAKGLGVTKRIISPTFVIIRSYKMDRYSNKIDVSVDAKIKGGFWTSQNDKNIFYHVDLYRLRGEEDIESTGLLEIMEDQNSILAVEWPEKLGSLLPKKRYDITFSHGQEDERLVTIQERQ